MDICMDYYHTWRAVVYEEFGAEKARELEIKWGKKLGEKTADVYRKVSWIGNNLANLAKALVISMRILNEECEAIIENEKSIRITHYSCPEYDEYARRGFPGGCIDKCFAWFAASAKGVNPSIEVELLKTFLKNDVCEIRLKIP